jgi:hypothetical protein
MEFLGGASVRLPFSLLSFVAFLEFKISNNFKQNVDEKQSKQPKFHRKKCWKSGGIGRDVFFTLKRSLEILIVSDQ